MSSILLYYGNDGPFNFEAKQQHRILDLEFALAPLSNINSVCNCYVKLIDEHMQYFDLKCLSDEWIY